MFDGQGFAAGQQEAEAALREYPSCGQLKIIVGGLYFHFLSSALSRADDPEQASEALIERCLALFEQGEAQSETEKEKLGARLLRINTLTMLGRYDEAETLIDSLPEKQPVDTDVLRINLHLAQERLNEAAQLSRKQLLTHVHEALSALMMLMTVARRQKDFPSAHRYWDTFCAMDELFILDRSNGLQLGILLAQDEGNTEQALDLFEQYIDARLTYTTRLPRKPVFCGRTDPCADRERACRNAPPVAPRYPRGRGLRPDPRRAALSGSARPAGGGRPGRRLTPPKNKCPKRFTVSGIISVRDYFSYLEWNSLFLVSGK